MIEYSEDLQKLAKKTKKDIKELIGKAVKSFRYKFAIAR